MEESLQVSLKYIFLMAVSIAIMIHLIGVLAEGAKITDKLPERPFDATAVHNLLRADCISGNRVFSFSAEKMDVHNGHALPAECFSDPAVAYLAKIFVDKPYASEYREWVFRSANFDDKYSVGHHAGAGFVDSIDKPKGTFARGAIIEYPDGTYIPGAMVAYIVTVGKIECQIEPNGEPCK